MMKARVFRIASFSLFFLLSLFATAHAQAATSGAPIEAPSPLSAIAHDFATWLNHDAGNGANNHRAGRHPSPLPRPRPAAELVPSRRVEQGMVGIRTAARRRVEEDNAHARSNK
jgi:hypothetical protein